MGGLLALLTGGLIPEPLGGSRRTRRRALGVPRVFARLAARPLHRLKLAFRCFGNWREVLGRPVLGQLGHFLERA
jgi:hypothetical protein